ncbi:Aldo/keto reductase [Thozetella sp. PMI_491]|nr:Aldo/keto reductase [Thozetella sp. PMI_491]
MEYVSGLKVSKVIFGCLVFSAPTWWTSPWTSGEEEGLKLLNDVGMNTFDTADIYSNGESEKIVGKALKKFNIPRSKVVILIKLFHPVNDGHTLQYLAEARGWAKFVSMQNYYNLTSREEEREMVPFWKATGVGVIPWSPLARGLLPALLGQRDSLRAQKDSFADQSNATANLEIVNRFEQLAAKKNVSMAVLSTAWVIYKGCTPILGLNKAERIDEILEALKVKLTEENLQ